MITEGSAGARQLLDVCTDGTHAREHAGADSLDERILASLTAERTVLGSAPEDGIAAVPSLSHSRLSVYDSALGATLASLPLTGDLAPYGWRLGPGASGQWHANRAFHARVLEAARLAYFGYEGPLNAARFGPALLAAATSTANGEKVLADRGLVRELPFLLAEGLESSTKAISERIPGAEVQFLLDERGSQRALSGRVRTASGYRFYRPLGTAGVSEIWGRLLSSLTPTGTPSLLLDSTDECVTAALDAGARSIALDPWAGELRTLGPLWEKVALARERGVAVTWALRADRMEQSTRHVLDAWSRLGFSPSQAQGFAFMVTRGRLTSPDAAPSAAAFVDDAHIDRLLRFAPAIAEKIQG